jgi:type IV pilus assembly protein PilM
MFGKKFIILDIGNDTTKIVCGTSDKNNIIIHEYDIIDTPKDCISDGMIINPELLSRTVTNAFKLSKISGGYLVLNVTGTGVITRDIMLPKSTDKDLAQLLEFEAQQYFPVDLKNYTTDFKVLETIGDQVRVFVVAAPNKLIESYLQLAKALKHPLHSIDIPSNCVLKLLSHVPFHSEESSEEYAVVDIGRDTSGVCIFRNNVLKFSRILLNGTAEIDSIIANRYNLEYKNAEALKISFKGFDVNLQETVHDEAYKDLGEVIKGALDNIISDINRFIEFYNSRENFNHVEKIYVYGGGSRLAGLTQYFSGNFNMPVLPFPELKEIIYKGHRDMEGFRTDYPCLINAIGGLARV